MHSEYVYPSLADRSAAGAWEEGGKTDLLDRAGERVREILSQHYPDYIDAKADAAIRERFPIRLPRDAMHRESRRW
jgi:trimethylamine--corrinoid protein Co-methyltransferase